MGKIIFAIAILVSLAGCQTREQLIQTMAQECAAYGFPPGTEAFAQCVQQQSLLEEKRKYCTEISFQAFGRPTRTGSFGEATGNYNQAFLDCMQGQ